MWEPFSRFPLGKINRRPYLDLNETDKDFEDFLNKIFEGKKVIHPGIAQIPYSKIKYLKDIITARKTLMKFTRAQRILPWLSQNYDFKKILIMRHLFATIASQLYHPAFDKNNTDHPFLSNYDFEIKGLENYIKNIDVFEKRLAITWCFDYLIPLKERDKCDETLLITYEKLVKAPVTELKRVEQFLNIELPEKIYDKIDILSQTTVTDSNVQKKHSNPLTTWKKRLSERQIMNILEVLDMFEVDFYSRELEPNYNILKSKYKVKIIMFSEIKKCDINIK